MSASSARTEPAPQHLTALQKANQIRLARAEVKRQVSAGEVSAAEVILACPEEVKSMAVMDLLMAQHRWGRQRCRKLLGQAQLAESKRIGRMTVRQRFALAGLLPDCPDNVTELPVPMPVRMTIEPVTRREPALAGAM